MLERDVDQSEGVGRGADDRGRLELGDRPQTIAALQAAERQRQRADVLDAGGRRPELQVGAERERQRHTVLRGDPRRREHAGEAAPRRLPVLPTTLLGRLQHAQLLADRPARQVQVGVGVQREGQVRAVGRRGGLVAQQFVLGRERQLAQILHGVDAGAAKPCPLERVGLMNALKELVERGDLSGSCQRVDRVIVGRRLRLAKAARSSAATSG